MSDLIDWRIAAAEKSGGTSDMHDAMERCLERFHAHGLVVDFGAGVGSLTRRLLESKRFESIVGVDIMNRPGDLPNVVKWITADLNEPTPLADSYADCVVACEIIEHLENPRAMCREISRILRPGGRLFMSTPNCENIRSLLSIWIRGCHWAFGPNSYPAHLTALLRIDLERCCREAGLMPLQFVYSDHGGIPRIPYITWQQVSFGCLKGLRFSDNVILVAEKTP